MLFQSSKLKARTSVFTETWQKRRSSFELCAFENVGAQAALPNNERNLNNAPDKEDNYNSTLSNAPDKQRFKQREQLQLNNETRDYSCAEGAVVDLAADTHIIYIFFAHMCCGTVQTCSCMNEPATNWHLSNLCLRFFTLAFVHACTQHDSHRHYRHKLSQIVQFLL